MEPQVPKGLTPVDSHAARRWAAGDTEHRRTVGLHPAHPEQNLALYIHRIEAAGWQLADQAFHDDGAVRRCSLRFVRPAR
ncbi:hypothetical protein ABT095_03750 [Kitasatospora sp. NPDC002227]|uniref:hypothetical protein n=1 Tax=Kitasatospora sp. NPDC002227 TaxID=3154773 RepID=UPI00332542FD